MEGRIIMTSEESCENMTATKKFRKKQENEKTLDAYASASEEERPSEEGRRADALAPGAEERRDKLR